MGYDRRRRTPCRVNGATHVPFQSTTVQNTMYERPILDRVYWTHHNNKSSALCSCLNVGEHIWQTSETLFQCVFWQPALSTSIGWRSGRRGQCWRNCFWTDLEMCTSAPMNASINFHIWIFTYLLRFVEREIRCDPATGQRQRRKFPICWFGSVTVWVEPLWLTDLLDVECRTSFSDEIEIRRKKALKQSPPSVY